MLCLVARFEDQVLRWPLPQGEALLGASSENDLVVAFPGVSRRHARVMANGNRVRLVDAGSKNGLVVNGTRQDDVEIGEGEVVFVGRASLTIEDARTSDVELAVTTAVSRRGGSADDTSDALQLGGADVNAALRLIRSIEAGGSKFSGRRRQQVLDRCRTLAGASAMLLCQVHNDGDIEVNSIGGTMPADDVLAGLLQRSKARSWYSLTRSMGETWFVAAGRASHHVVATFNGRPDSWVEDFVAFVAEKLIAAPESRGDDEPHLHTEGSETPLAIPDGMVIGTSHAMTSLMRQVAATVGSGMDVLLLGETGTGKELFARIVHDSGPNSDGPFVAINCAAIPSELLESELFGVIGRVATGVDPRAGHFAKADGGSIFLDEIGELPERLQAKLLRVLQEREVFPLGAAAPRKISVQVISASNRNLAARVQEGHFRADLYYRLRGLEFHIPPLRERREDIATLALEFIARAAKTYRKDVRGISRSALRTLTEHDWPGNVRELDSEIRRAVLMCPNGAVLQIEHLDSVRWQLEHRTTPAATAPAPNAPEPPAAPPDQRPLRHRVDAMEKEEIERALQASGGNRSRAARLLGITRNGLALKLRRLGLLGDNRPTKSDK